MIDGKKISVIITTYCRYGTLDAIIGGWLAQPAEEVWVLDGGGKFKAKAEGGRLLVFNLPRDLGTKMDYAFALLTDGDLVCLADDDLLPSPGFLEDLYAAWKQKGGIVGTLGHTFQGPVYRANTTFFRGDLVPAATRVDFCGVVLLAAREVFGFDVRGCPRNCDDLWLAMKAHPELPKHVVATKRFKNTMAAIDGTAMYRDPKLRGQRQDFYREYYIKNYAGKR
jgi:glycosyltransferase involved in cell wall biosynthesis